MKQQLKIGNMFFEFSYCIEGATEKVYQWVETNPSNIRFFPTDICFYLASWYYANGLRMSVYGCSQMFDGLVSSHP